VAWSDLPQVPSRWNAGQPRCLQCVHLRIDDHERNVYANAWCSLMPSFGFFNRHFAACLRFEDSGVATATAQQRRVRRG
jgi:hypothetical protein